jgi:hypothetical protein
MATYVNDLRLKEIATGDESGTWGTSTNTNLELIAEAFSYGTEAITTNADTHTTTIADGASDPGRALYLKYTGTLDSACTITIGPDTVSKVWIIENGTSGSQDIILSQGSGANITIPAGDTKVVYSDGAGAGAAFFDAFASLSVVDLKVQDDLTVTDDASIGGDATITGTLGVTGDITGTLATAAQPNITSLGTLTGLTTTGDINFGDDDKAIFGAGSDLQIYHDGSNSRIYDTGTGDLRIQGTNLRLMDANGGDYLYAVQDSYTKLYYNDLEKLATTATGIDVTGTVDADKLSIDTGATNVTIDSGGIYNSLNTTGVTYVVSDTNAAAGLFAYGTAHATKPSTVEIKAGGSVRATITSTGNVGIGTTSPSAKLSVLGTTKVGEGVASNTSKLMVNTLSGTAAGIQLLQDGVESWIIQNLASTTALTFGNSGTERVRIDSSGNFMVGKTAVDNTTVGFRFDGSSGFSSFVRDGNAPLLLVRKSDDGDILQFKKDTTTVGSIGVIGSDVTIGNGDTGLRFVASIDAIAPATLSTPANRDAAIDLGTSAVRFKDLYLSGGVYLGGTGAANLLDDYEEGTFSPTIVTSGSTVSYTSQLGSYTKVGRAVHFSYAINLNVVTSQGSGTFELGGLPFASASTNINNNRYVCQTYGIDFDSSKYQFYAYTPSTSVSILRVLYTTDNGTWTVATTANFAINNSDTIVICGTYFTD